MNSQEKKAGLSWKIKDWIAGYIFIAPVTIGLTVFYIWPFLQNFWFSFNDVNKFNVTHFIGLENYKQLLSDPEVFQTFGNTLKYVVVTVLCIFFRPSPWRQRLRWFGNGYLTGRWES